MIEEDDLKKLEQLLESLPFPEKLYKVSKEEYSKVFIEYLSSKYSIIPELASLLDFETFLKVLYIFAGQAITFPNYNSISSNIRDLDIYFSLNRNNTPEEQSRLGVKYSSTPNSINWTYNKVLKNLNKQ